MTSLLFAMVASFLAATGARDQLLVARLSAAFGLWRAERGAWENWKKLPSTQAARRGSGMSPGWDQSVRTLSIPCSLRGSAFSLIARGHSGQQEVPPEVDLDHGGQI